MEKKFIDTNIFLRYLTKDLPAKYERCKELFRETLTGKISLITSEMVIAELIWTLLSYYKLSKNDAIEKISIIVSTENIFIPNKNIIIESLTLYSRKNIDYIDAYNAVFMKHYGCNKIYSYDEDFDTVENIERQEP